LKRRRKWKYDSERENGREGESGREGENGREDKRVRIE
jgi:hypothetical protein